MSEAIFAAGCFWGVEAAFRKVEGVSEAVVGYTGGKTTDPNYREVCSGSTGHAEAVKVSFDPNKVGFERLTEVFFQIHDPTTLNQQGPDHGTQYRSGIFYLDDSQKEIAEKVKTKFQQRWDRPIVTEITPASEFYLAEEYHQRYFEKQGR